VRKTALFIAVTALASFGIAVSGPKPHFQTASAQRGGAFVLLGRDAFLYSAPDLRAEKVRDPFHAQHRVRLGPWWVLRRRAVRDGWVELRTIPGFRATAHCYRTVSGLEDLDLRLYAREDALAEVTTAAVTRAFEDGTRLRLTAGVGVKPRGGGRYDAIVPGATIRVRLREEELGRSYDGVRTFGPSRQVVGLLAPGGRLDFQGGRLVAEAASRRVAARGTVDFSVADTRGGSDSGPARALLAVETEGRRGRMPATVRGPCVEAHGELERPPRNIHSLSEHHGTRIRAGALLHWPDGTRAGRAATDTALDGRITPRGPRRCFAHRLRASGGHSEDETLSLCVDSTDVM
jgi:hypothetical protein